MPTNLITSLDQLEPGMKTKNGGWHKFIRGWGSFFFRIRLNQSQAESLFLNQEVEVPE